MLCGCTAFAEAHENDRWLPEYTYSGEIKLPEYMNTEFYFPIVKEGADVTLTLGLIYDDTYTDPDQVKDSWFYTWLSQFTGIKFDYMLIPKSALNERKALVFLEEKLPDILMGYKLTETELVTYGDLDQVLLDMTPYIHPDIAPSISLLMETRPDAKGAVTTPSGKIYTLPQVYSDIDSNGYGKSELMFVRTDWLKEAGYETAPTTLDGFTEMLYKFKANHPDCIPLAASDGQQDVRTYILNAMGYLTDVENDTGFGPALRNGEVVIPAYTETFKEFLKVMNEYYVNGLIPPDYFTLDTTAEDAMLAQDNWGATNRASMSYISNEPAVFQQYWTGYPLTSQWNDKQQVAKYTNVNKIGGVAIAADTKYPEVCVRLLDFWFTELGNIYQWEGPAYGSSDTLGIHSCVAAVKHGRCWKAGSVRCVTTVRRYLPVRNTRLSAICASTRWIIAYHWRVWRNTSAVLRARSRALSKQRQAPDTRSSHCAYGWNMPRKCCVQARAWKKPVKRYAMQAARTSSKRLRDMWG